MTKTYTMAVHVPIYMDGDECYAAAEWRRALYLLRDSFAGAFDRFICVAPTLQAAEDGQNFSLLPVGGSQKDGWEISPSISLKMGKREYWLMGGRAQWRQDVGRALAISELGHMGLGDLYRPINYDALRLSLDSDVTTIFVRDTDEVTKMRNLLAAKQIRNGPDRKLYLWAYERAMRNAVARADLSLLKGRALMTRYQDYAKNPKYFHNTSYHTSEIIASEVIETRIATLSEGRPLRFVYCGRLVPRKGCDHSIRMVSAAVKNGANIRFDLIGDGPQRAELEALAHQEGVADRVSFLGERPYGSDLLLDLAQYDGLLFTPLSEDTPRMIFDGYASGLPLIGYDIPYVQERAAEEHATHLLPAFDIAGAATVLQDLGTQRNRLSDLAKAAHRAAFDNASEVWYERRADWTLEAHARRQASRSA